MRSAIGMHLTSGVPPRREHREEIIISTLRRPARGPSLRFDSRLAVAATPRAHDASVLRRSDSGSSVASRASDICVGDVDVDVDDLEAAPDVRAIRRILLARDFERATPTVTP